MTAKKLILSVQNSHLVNFDNYLAIGEWTLKKKYYDFYKLNKKKIEIFKSNSYKKENRANAHKITSDIYDFIKKDLIIELNKLHGKNYSSRFWGIIFGYWLIHFIGICVERYMRFNEITKDNRIDKIFLRSNNEFNFSSKDTFGLNINSIDDNWENNFFSTMINFFEYDFQIFNNNSNTVGYTGSFFDYSNSKNKKSGELKNIFNKILNFNYSKKALITNTYLPKKYEFLLQLLFFQTPSHYNLREISYKNINNQLRKKITLIKDKEKNLENFIRLIIPKCLPLSIVENFSNIYKDCENVRFPKKPKLIFTSLSYAYDEYFKFYTAKKVENGVPYFIGQHGNEYFTHNFSNKIEFEISDKFISWGYHRPNKILSSFNFKTFKKPGIFDKKGKLLIISHPSVHRVFSYDRFCDYKDSLINAVNLKDKVSNKISNEIILRLDKDFQSYDFILNEKILKNFKNNEICFGTNKLENLIKKSRLCIFTYDSTGLLENLSLNIPSLGMWNSLDNHLNEEFKEKYLLMKKANIFFDNVSYMANHVNENWQDINKWWFSDKTQLAIKKFNKDFNNNGKFKSFINLKEKLKID